MKLEGIAEHAFKYFTPVFANTDYLKQEAFKIRYQVYCQELKYEPIENFPDRMEKDIYDSRSYHFLLKHNPSGEYAGCLRLICGDAKDPQAQFPFEKVCQELKVQPSFRHHFFEISRFAVLEKFRKRTTDKATPVGAEFIREIEKEDGQTETIKIPAIALCLHGIHISVAAGLGIDAFCVMERTLARHLRIYGIKAHQIGPMVEYHGKRGPFLLKTREIMNEISSPLRELFENIQQQLLPSLQPAHLTGRGA